ncbi:hypothetical protein AAFF_G00317050 [Aldrovandia affinis]|uniref:Uncharacterized protein n=1 Tax=Aldrovandia affinis TaxID=143900 RepID=A0AAD7W0W9_9TELE|nr:hypothetical protein AAFF_G00317050 [Aldrovandia affinis]
MRKQEKTRGSEDGELTPEGERLVLCLLFRDKGYVSERPGQRSSPSGGCSGTADPRRLTPGRVKWGHGRNRGNAVPLLGLTWA